MSARWSSRDLICGALEKGTKRIKMGPTNYTLRREAHEHDASIAGLVRRVGGRRSGEGVKRVESLNRFYRTGD